MSTFRNGIGAAFILFAIACGPIDTEGEAVDMVVVEGTASALGSTPAHDTHLEGQLDLTELEPIPGVHATDASTMLDRSIDQEERDCTFQERADVKCPAGKLLGTCTVFYEEWADGSIHVGAIARSCSIDAAPSSGAN